MHAGSLPGLLKAPGAEGDGQFPYEETIELDADVEAVSDFCICSHTTSLEYSEYAISHSKQASTEAATHV